MSADQAKYWDWLASRYQKETRISCDDIHYGPLLPGDAHFALVPGDLHGTRCFEAGCGGGQNAVVLARRGGQCTAMDISRRQLDHARALCQQHNVQVEFVQGDLDCLPLAQVPCFDLILSSFSLPFCRRAPDVVRAWASRLVPGGLLVFSTAHPLCQAEWLVVDEGEEGIFLQDYFRPPTDVRAGGGGRSACTPVPLSELFLWLREAGLEVTAFHEPRPVPRQRVRQDAPYWSQAWLERHAALTRVPAVALFAARKSP